MNGYGTPTLIGVYIMALLKIGLPLIGLAAPAAGNYRSGTDLRCSDGCYQKQ
ncbi:MAG: hypothetical protein ACLUOI_16665 [Eisenbergiella sp.]